MILRTSADEKVCMESWAMDALFFKKSIKGNVE